MTEHMNPYIPMILEDREKIQQRKDACMAEFDAQLKAADDTLSRLGYFGPANVVPMSTSPGRPSLKDRTIPTIKERVTETLGYKYPQGAHYSAILEFINMTWPQHPVSRTSLSPQLTRLRKKDKLIELDEEQGIWFLVSPLKPKKNEAPNVGASNRGATLFNTLEPSEGDDSAFGKE